MNELCHLWQSERYVACGDDTRRGPSRAKRARFPLVPPSETRLAAVVSNYPPNLKVVTMPVRCPAYRYCMARAALPAQTCEPLQFNDLSQCRTQSLRRVSISARGKPFPFPTGNIPGYVLY